MTPIFFYVLIAKSSESGFLYNVDRMLLDPLHSVCSSTRCVSSQFYFSPPDVAYND